MCALKPKIPPNIFKAIRVDRKIDVRMYDRQNICCSLKNGIDFRTQQLWRSRSHPVQGDGFIIPEMQDSEVRQLVDRFSKLGEYIRLLRFVVCPKRVEGFFSIGDNQR